MGNHTVRPTFYLWYLNGKVLTPTGRCIGRYETLSIAMRNFPEATFRISRLALLDNNY